MDGDLNTSSSPVSGELEGDELEGYYVNLGARRWLAAWLGSIAVVGFFGNVLVVTCVILYPKLRTITNVYLTSLAVSDILVSLTIPWIIVGMVSTRGWPFPDETCIIVAILRFTSSGSSVWHLVAIGFNRMFLITTSTSTYKKIYSRVNTATILFVTWLIPFSVIIVPYAIGATQLGYDDGPKLCSDLEDRPDGTENLTHTYLAGTFLTCIPLFIVICVYLRIFVHIKQHVRKQKAWSSGQQQENTRTTGTTATAQDTVSPEQQSKQNTAGLGTSTTVQDPESSGKQQNIANPTAANRRLPVKKGKDLETRITKNTFYVTLGFFLCILPYGIYILGGGWFRIKGTPLAQAFLLFNICMNPVIYGTKHPHFRVAIRNIFSRRLSGALVTSNSVDPANHTQGST
ncbi:beta-3 adrenergic receptor-like [Lytechinus variegatus]|uniref:beta-3 adrenergic receptor-like n=1 Tax=Lytechinus variegatus TaxID=7654 RepID=UPI001BB25DB0|nr:beta-3 adrenergic receptor-like [Lytechinus variegatus]